MAHDQITFPIQELHGRYRLCKLYLTNKHSPIVPDFDQPTNITCRNELQEAVIVDACNFLVVLKLPIHQRPFLEMFRQFDFQLFIGIVSVFVLLFAMLLALTIPFFFFRGKHDPQVETCWLFRVQVYCLPRPLMPLKKMGLTRLESQQDMSLAHDVMHWVFDHFHCSDGSEQEPFAVYGELSILEAPDFELIFRTDSHYALLAL